MVICHGRKDQSVRLRLPVRVIFVLIVSLQYHECLPLSAETTTKSQKPWMTKDLAGDASNGPPQTPSFSLPPSSVNSRRAFFQTAAKNLLVASVSSSVLVGVPGPQNQVANAVPSFDNIRNPFIPYFETADQVPKDYFDNHRSIYAFVERIVDGDTMRVRHIPGYNPFFPQKDPTPLTSRGIADQTLMVRLYGIDTPEKGQPFSQQAKNFTTELVYHRIVRVTFLRRDQYRRAVCQVETLPKNVFLNLFLPGFGPKDLTVELAAAGLAELYVGGGAEYNNKRDVLEKWVERAKRNGRGVWTLGDDRVSAAEYKKIQKQQLPPVVVVQPPTGALAIGTVN